MRKTTLAADESGFALFPNGLDVKTGIAPFYYCENLFNVTGAVYGKIDYK